MSFTRNRSAYFRLGLAWTAGFALLVLTIQLALVNIRYGHVFKVGDQLATRSQLFELKELDLTAEPGEIGERETLTEFYERQAQIYLILTSEEVFVNEVKLIRQDIEDKISGQPPIFWIQLTVGLGAYLISAWVWALRRNHRPARYFFISGIATLVFTFAAAIYTTRELALPVLSFKILVGLNVLGASAFGLSLLHLFAIYPRNFAKWKVSQYLTSALFGTWTILAVAELLPPWAGVNLITLTEMIGLCLAVFIQFRLTRKDPVARASLVYLGLAVISGAGFFIALNAAPLVFGSEVQIEQGYAFLSFLFLYIGLAAGIVRFRLFEVGDWAFRFLFYGVGAAGIFLIDGLLIYSVGAERLPAFAFSLLAMSFFYLPLKGFLRDKFFRSCPLKEHELLQSVLDVTFASSDRTRLRLWKDLLVSLYKPLHIRENHVMAEEPSVQEDGESLILPTIGTIPSYTLSHRHGGQRLFARDSLDLARQLASSMRRAESNRNAYDRGTREERRRISQDLHDDIGASLLTVLNHADENTRTSIQSVITDIRSILNGMDEDETRLEDLLADLRYDTISRLHASGVDAQWHLPLPDLKAAGLLTPRAWKAFRSSVRELVSNIIRHSSATAAEIWSENDDGCLRLIIKDNGKGIGSDVMNGATKGFGLRGIKRRLGEIGAEFVIHSEKGHTICSISLAYGNVHLLNQTHTDGLTSRFGPV